MSKIENAENVRLFALNSNQPLARRLSEKLGLPLSDATITHFADGEISITINESVRGREVYVLQSVSQPVNTNLMELLIMVDALRRASAAKINVIHALLWLCSSRSKSPQSGTDHGQADCQFVGDGSD